MIPLFDTHCDAPHYLYKHNRSLKDSTGHVSLEKAEIFSPYIQVAAIWCTCADSSTALESFRATIDKFDNECRSNGCDLIRDRIGLIASAERQATGDSSAGFIYCIEDCGFITNLDILSEVYDRGVRILIPMWGKTNALGGSHESEEGLTCLGRDILTEAAKMGFILDISHASVRSSYDIMDIAEKTRCPVIASHSNSQEFYKHSRNLNKEQIERLASLNGIIGHSLCPWHLAENGEADLSTVIGNIEFLISLAGEDNVCFGCDLDGTDLPKGFSDITSLEPLYAELSKKFSPLTADKIYFKNAYQKFQQFLK